MKFANVKELQKDASGIISLVLGLPSVVWAVGMIPTILIILFLPSITASEMIGTQAYIVTPMNYPHIAVDEKALDAYIKAIASNDIPHGVLELYQQRRLFQVENGVKVKILDLGFGKAKVRILEGDKTGYTGWIVSEWVNITPPKKQKEYHPEEDTSLRYSTEYPTSMPTGYDKRIKYKYRVVENLGDLIFTIYDTNRYEKLSTGAIKLYPPIFCQEYFSKPLGGDHVGKWTKKQIESDVVTNQSIPNKLSIIKKR
jgi:hypothetical protein